METVGTRWTGMVCESEASDGSADLCGPQLIQAGKGEALRIRAILRSLVPIEDLVGVISLPVQIPTFGKGECILSIYQADFLTLCPIRLSSRWPLFVVTQRVRL